MVRDKHQTSGAIVAVLRSEHESQQPVTATRQSNLIMIQPFFIQCGSSHSEKAMPIQAKVSAEVNEAPRRRLRTFSTLCSEDLALAETGVMKRVITCQIHLALIYNPSAFGGPFCNKQAWANLSLHQIMVSALACRLLRRCVYGGGISSHPCPPYTIHPALRLI